jgi:hypothetical protein
MGRFIICTPHQISFEWSNKKKNKIGRACSMYWERTGAYRALVGKTEKRRPLERPRRRWKDNIKMDLQIVGWGSWAVSI